MNASNSCGMRTVRRCANRLLTSACMLALFLVGLSPVSAGPGHDHADAAPAASVMALPRFTAASDLFELVGILNGRQLTLYLDHADTNAPVENAKLEVELGGAKLALEPHGDGEFVATLADAPKPGTIPVTAMVATQKDSDLLAGSLDLHDPGAATSPVHVHDWKQWLPWGLGGIVLAALAIGVARRRRASRAAHAGASA